ncbi:unnamed protein product [Mycetohabitans rhizoxinica HKI 454]|uniref:Uncharacterized protein n=1 Tax=Mycetohabitans rhizoxinica (strain DSM 19002 / CIP 109453 / HKI 454) TaxID=882378 RepID=E5AR89_MYCRK|nr:unnamed protein product [Mycetohabitans rhizoxinica HKI 454]
MQFIAGLIQFSRRTGSVERSQDAAEFGRVGCLHTSRGILAKQGFKPFVPKTDYHAASVA